MVKTQAHADDAFDQVVDWLEHFEPLDDPRQSGKVLYPLDEVLLLCLLAVLAGAEGWVEIAEFGKAKLEFLRRFRAFEMGTPSHDQLGDLFAASTRKPSSSASSTGSPRYGCLGRCGR